MSPPKQILLIEDDISLVTILEQILRIGGYHVRSAYNGRRGLQELTHLTPDLILLDLGLPDMDGFALLKEIRRQSSVPVVVLSAIAKEPDKVHALESGADDYVTKPFDQEELLARIAALLRRVSWSPQSETTLQVGELRIDMARRQVTLRDRLIHLTPIEYAILCTLMQNAGKVVSHEELLTSVWGPGYAGDYSVLRVNISRLRQKVEESSRQPSYIQTVPRRGYRMPANAQGGG